MKKPSANPMEVSFDCLICYDILKEPRVTSCGHTFCFGCLVQIKSNNKNSFPCPICKKENGPVESLPKNFIVEQWIEDNKQTISKKQIPLCDNCENDPNPAKVWCESCSHYLCGDCDTEVHSLKITINHQRITTREKSIQSNLSKCSRHKEEMKFFL